MRPLLLLVVVLLAGCNSDTSKSPPAPVSDLEISRDPSILVTHRDKWDQMTLYGVGIGHDTASIPNKKVSERVGDGWIMMRDTNRYRDTAGKVTTVGVWQNSLLEKLGVKKQDDVERVFGKPLDYLRVSTSIHLYTYQEGHVHVIWNQTERKLTAVNLITSSRSSSRGVYRKPFGIPPIQYNGCL